MLRLLDEGGKLSPQELLVQLGKFPGHHDLAIAQRLQHVAKGRQHPFRRFVKDEKRPLAGERQQPLPSFSLTIRQKSRESEVVGGKPRGRERGDGGAGSRYRHYGDPCGHGVAHQLKAGIGDAGSPGVGDERHAKPLLQPFQDVIPFEVLVVVEVRGERPGDAEMGQQLPGMAGVFRRDQIGFLQDAQGAQRDVLQIPDRRGYDIKNSGCHNLETVLRSMFNVLC